MAVTGMPEAQIQLAVPFCDIDSLEVVWHGHYWKYFEQARTELFRKLNYDFPDMKESGYAWPVVDCSCRYLMPLRYGMTVIVRAEMTEYELLVKIKYSVTDAASGKILCRGGTTQVAVDMHTGETCMSSPELLRKRILEYAG